MGQPFAGFEAGVATILGRASIRVGTSHFSYLSLVDPYNAVGLLSTNCVLNADTKKCHKTHQLTKRAPEVLLQMV